MHCLEYILQRRKAMQTWWPSAEQKVKKIQDHSKWSSKWHIQFRTTSELSSSTRTHYFYQSVRVCLLPFQSQSFTQCMLPPALPQARHRGGLITELSQTKQKRCKDVQIRSNVRTVYQLSSFSDAATTTTMTKML